LLSQQQDNHISLWLVMSDSQDVRSCYSRQTFKAAMLLRSKLKRIAARAKEALNHGNKKVLHSDAKHT